MLLFFGLQGVHQFYLGNYRRGFAILLLIHVPTFYFAYLEQNGRLTNPDDPLPVLLQLLVIFIALLTGLGFWLRDLFTLPRQLK